MLLRRPGSSPTGPQAGPGRRTCCFEGPAIQESRARFEIACQNRREIRFRPEDRVAPCRQGCRGRRRPRGCTGPAQQVQGGRVQDRRGHRPPDPAGWLQAVLGRGIHEPAAAGVFPPAPAELACGPGGSVQADHREPARGSA
ncbi:hypothetical protein G6F50_014368 [Rhizopus delemar]|uniref:Uncharacterized protein n=1 Tax=Rhizopus delemar TaxID=936053 RepID=A0A9P6Y655_9FUNG|nr:hypothetical protein G6F50_014368 [Rhizopus delemar]